jgi:hypothetical protein
MSAVLPIDVAGQGAPATRRVSFAADHHPPPLNISLRHTRLAPFALRRAPRSDRGVVSKTFVFDTPVIGSRFEEQLLLALRECLAHLLGPFLVFRGHRALPRKGDQTASGSQLAGRASPPILRRWPEALHVAILYSIKNPSRVFIVIGSKAQWNSNSYANERARPSTPGKSEYGVIFIL